MFEIKQYIPQDYCQHCLGCCRYNCNPSIWAPKLLEDEEELFNLGTLKLVSYQQSYICCFLEPKSNLCNVYAKRPMECRLYPFLLNRSDSRLYLSLDLNCPYIKDEISSRNFKRYLDYLISYFQSRLVLDILIRNLHFFPSYPPDKVLDLVELDF